MNQTPVNAVPTLAFEDVEVAYTVRGIDRPVLRSVSFEVMPGEAYGLVGESGCGKSTAAYAAMRYLPRNGKITSGKISFEGRDLITMSVEEVRKLRSRGVEAAPAQVTACAKHFGELALVVEQARVTLRHNEGVAKLAELRERDRRDEDGRDENEDVETVVHGIFLSVVAADVSRL